MYSIRAECLVKKKADVITKDKINTEFSVKYRVFQ